MERKLEQIHLQITRNCNLRCYFCGQWGKKGFFSDASGEEMNLKDWEKVIFDIVRYREKTGISPFVMIWGGEPLVSPYFEPIVKLLHMYGFKVGIVTNGVLINRYQEIINEAVQKVYVSLDGMSELHDSARGKGVFEKTVKNIENLIKPDITVMSVVTKKLLHEFYDFLNFLNSTNIKELYFQDMIGLTTEEVENYKKMLEEEFGIRPEYIDAWENNECLQFHEELDDLLNRIDRSFYHYEIHYKKHDASENRYCLSPFRHVHVTWNGNVTYCTDFYDFTAGNVKEERLEKIFVNEMSEKYRTVIMTGKSIICRHCSWKGNTVYS